MDLKTMFPNLTVMWTRWSDYEVTDWEGIEYLVPAKAATALTGGRTTMSSLNMECIFWSLHRMRHL